MHEARVTLPSQAWSSVPADGGENCMLVQIYPVEGIGQPIALREDQDLVGRDPQCSLHLEDESVSRRHAILERHGERHTVTDLGSTNGSFVNERRVLGTEMLHAGDRLRFGNQIFKYLTAHEIEAQYHEVVFKMMTTDGLTGVHNKRYFLQALDREIAQARRDAAPMCVMIMDLDRFKAINDTFGHLAGDAVLVEFARRARSVLRSGQLLARYGGEEFVLLTTRTTPPEAFEAAERIRQAIAASPVSVDSKQIPVSVSIGMCSFDGHEEREAQDLIAEADRMLYWAKESGRNQVRHRDQGRPASK